MGRRPPACPPELRGAFAPMCVAMACACDAHVRVADRPTDRPPARPPARPLADRCRCDDICRDEIVAEFCPIAGSDALLALFALPSACLPLRLTHIDAARYSFIHSFISRHCSLSIVEIDDSKLIPLDNELIRLKLTEWLNEAPRWPLGVVVVVVAVLLDLLLVVEVDRLS